MGTTNIPHISVCACTYKRPDLLERLLNGLATLETRGLFTYGIGVVDNDTQQSAKALVTQFAPAVQIDVKYVTELRQSIARARNAAVANADGDFIAFIDDDEFPTTEW